MKILALDDEENALKLLTYDENISYMDYIVKIKRRRDIGLISLTFSREKLVKRNFVPLGV